MDSRIRCFACNETFHPYQISLIKNRPYCAACTPILVDDLSDEPQVTAAKRRAALQMWDDKIFPSTVGDITATHRKFPAPTDPEDPERGDSSEVVIMDVEDPEVGASVRPMYDAAHPNAGAGAEAKLDQVTVETIRERYELPDSIREVARVARSLSHQDVQRLEAAFAEVEERCKAKTDALERARRSITTLKEAIDTFRAPVDQISLEALQALVALTLRRCQ